MGDVHHRSKCSTHLLMESMTRFAKVGLTLIAILLVLATMGCSDSGEGDGGVSSSASQSASQSASGCDEVNALKGSLTALTQLNPLSDGIDASRSAVAKVKTDPGCRGVGGGFRS